MPQAVTRLAKYIHDCLLNDYEVAPRQLAKMVGKPYPTLLREINPFDTKAKLGVDTLMEIMYRSGDVRILEFMASSLGYKLTPMRDGDVISSEEFKSDEFCPALRLTRDTRSRDILQ